MAKPKAQPEAPAQREAADSGQEVLKEILEGLPRGPALYALLALGAALALLVTYLQVTYLQGAGGPGGEPTVVPAAPAAPGPDPRLRGEQWAPVSVGKRRLLKFADGRDVPMTTLALRPGLFLLEGLLSSEEVDAILAAAPEADFRSSTVSDSGSGSVGADTQRVSETQFIQGKRPALMSLLQRVADLSGLPLPWVQATNMQVLRYAGQSYYATHYDSRQLETYAHCRGDFEATGLPPDADSRCPRYITILYYLSDVEDGGETCFPLADDPALAGMSDAELYARQKEDKNFMRDASMRCVKREGAVFAPPKRGDAVMWYNYRQAEGGALGNVDGLAAHMAMIPMGGSVKLAANHWLTVPWWPDEAAGAGKAAEL